MRFLKLLKLMAPASLAVVALSVNPDTSNGQFPGGDRGGRGDRGSRGGEQPAGGAVQFQFAQPAGGAVAPVGGVQFQMPQGGGRGGDRGDRGGRGGGFGGMPQGGFGGMPAGGGGFGGMPQGGGGGFGGFGGGRGGFDPNTMADSSFARLQASYGGSGETLDYSKIPAATREQTNAMAQRFGGEAMPASGSISKDQFRDQMAKRMEAMRGGGGRQTFSMTAPGTVPGATTGMVSFDTPGAMPGGQPGQQPWGQQQQQWGQQPGGGRDRGPGGDRGNDPSQMTDEQIKQFMSRTDTDQDGRISAAEAQTNDRLRSAFPEYDTNRDGFIDMTEYRAYLVVRMGGGNRGGDPNSMSQSWNGQPGGGYGPDGSRLPMEEPKPVVLRYGKLPKELPSWFNSLDTNQDGQIALYEWRNEGRLATDFTPMDSNGDGLVTAEEYLRFKNPNMSISALTSGAPREGGGNPFGGGAGAPPRGGNPFGGGSSGGGNPFGGGNAAGPPRTGNPFGGKSSETRSENGPPSREEKRERKEEMKGSRPTGGNPGGNRRSN